MLRKIKRALISVSDKAGIVEIAKFLKGYGVEIISTGGTYKALKDQGIEVKDISEITNFPEIMDGRVKTLHPSVHGGLLAVLDNSDHQKAMQENGINPIELVIVNLYPFENTVLKGAPYEEVVENIDIGGPSMIRSASKNHHYTTVVVEPNDYDALKAILAENDGATTIDFRKSMAAKAFARTAEYDSAISSWFAKTLGQSFPDKISFGLSKAQDLRYGENPHQKAAVYKFNNSTSGIMNSEQIQGKELSYNNINDADAALALLAEFSEPACVIVKHANPCGVAIGSDINEAYSKALDADSLSAFGGIVALNREINASLATELAKMFLEVILAPSISDEAKKVLSAKKNLRVLLVQNQDKFDQYTMKSVNGGLLIQENDFARISRQDLTEVTNLKPTEANYIDLLFAFKVVKHVKSNAIVIAKNGATIGIGAGQMSRVDSVKNALEKPISLGKSDATLQGAALASDAFFPFPDSIIIAANKGIKSFIQPGGSIKDEEVINEANNLGVSMVFTGIRNFKH